MCQPKECVQQLKATNFVSHELKTDAAYWLHTTFRGFAMAGSFSTKLYSENGTSTLHKCVCEARNPRYRKPHVSGSCFSVHEDLSVHLSYVLL